MAEEDDSQKTEEPTAKKLEKARGTLTGAILGVVIIVCAYLILLTIKAITGVDVTKFTVPTK